MHSGARPSMKEKIISFLICVIIYWRAHTHFCAPFIRSSLHPICHLLGNLFAQLKKLKTFERLLWFWSTDDRLGRDWLKDQSDNSVFTVQIPLGANGLNPAKWNIIKNESRIDGNIAPHLLQKNLCSVKVALLNCNFICNNDIAFIFG